MQVAAVSTRANADWRWRIVSYAGEVVEESRETFPSIAAAVAHGAKRLAQMDVVDRSVPATPYRSTARLRRR